MKVKKLIELLQQQDPEKTIQVLYDGQYGDYFNIEVFLSSDGKYVCISDKD